MKTEKRKGDRVTIKDVAKAAGVSIATVSYVLNNTHGQSISEDTRKKVLQSVNLLGYKCNIMAKYLATGRANAVAVVIDDMPTVASQYYMQFITELSRLLPRRKIDLKIIDYADGLQSDSPCDAFVTLALSESRFKAFADTKYVPVIAVDSMFDDVLFYRINDDYKRMYNSTKQGADDPVILLTHPLPDECIAHAQEFFDGVKVVNDVRDLPQHGSNEKYVTVSALIKKFANNESVKLYGESVAFKAAAAADSALKAIDRTQATSSEHDISV